MMMALAGTRDLLRRLVLAGGLAELFGSLGDVEHVVDDLEAHPEVLAELRERVERVGRDLAHHAADATRRRHE